MLEIVEVGGLDLSTELEVHQFSFGETAFVAVLDFHSIDVSTKKYELSTCSY